MNIFSNLKNRVMSRIYFEYAKNVFMGHPDYFMLFVFLVISFMLISIGDVLANLPKDNFSSAFNFLVAALKNTSWIIQTLIAGFLIRVLFVGSKLTYKNMRNMNAGRFMARFRY